MRERTRITTKLRLVRKSLIRKRWSRVDLLTEQDRWWVDRHGNLHDINKIDRDYQENLLYYFRQNAARYQAVRIFTQPRGWGYDGPDESAWEEMFGPAREWIERQPLAARLRELTAPKTRRKK
jgi:hypothetical protein